MMAEALRALQAQAQAAADAEARANAAASLEARLAHAEATRDAWIRRSLAPLPMLGVGVSRARCEPVQ